MPAKPTRLQALAAVVTGVLFFSWLSYLIFLWWTLPHAPGGGPVVLSRPQFLISNDDVIAQIDSLTGPVTIKEVVFPTKSPREAALRGQTIRVTNLRQCRPLATWYTITDATLAALRANKVPEDWLAALQPLKDKRLEHEVFGNRLNEILNGLAREQNLDRDKKDHFQNLVLLYGLDARVELTNPVFDSLRGVVPENVLAKLRPLKNEEFKNQEAFVAGLRKILDDKERENYQNLLLNKALLPEPIDYTGPGEYILALRPVPPEKALAYSAGLAGLLALPGEGSLLALSVPEPEPADYRTYAVSPTPPSPGFRLGPCRLYRAIPTNVAQLRQITALKPE